MQLAHPPAVVPRADVVHHDAAVSVREPEEPDAAALVILVLAEAVGGAVRGRPQTVVEGLVGVAHQGGVRVGVLHQRGRRRELQGRCKTSNFNRLQFLVSVLSGTSTPHSRDKK